MHFAKKGEQGTTTTFCCPNFTRKVPYVCCEYDKQGRGISDVQNHSLEKTKKFLLFILDSQKQHIASHKYKTHKIQEGILV